MDALSAAVLANALNNLPAALIAASALGGWRLASSVVTWQPRSSSESILAPI
jgi:hypothetical protein